MKTLQVLYHLLLLVTSVFSCTVRLDSQWPGTTVVSTDVSKIIIKCVRTNFAVSFTWRIHRENDILRDYNDETFNRFGFYLSPLESTDSLVQVLNINETIVNNNTIIVCSGGTSQETTQLVVYQPIILAVRDVSVHSVNISWSQIRLLVNITYGLTENYTLKARSNNSLPTMFSSDESFFVFTSDEVINNSSCVELHFSVLTSFTSSIHEGDCISESNAVTTILPALPNISSLESSIKHSLTRNVGSVFLSVSFMPASTCSERHHVTGYMLEVISDQKGVAILNATNYRTSPIIISSNELDENVKYLFKIITSNTVGNVSTNNTEFYTTDVQNVTATTAQENENALVVQCDFITGSNAQGCMVVLVGEFENTTMSYNLTRESPCTTLTLNMSHNYTQVFGFDIESDGTVSTLPVPGLIARNVSMTCPSIIEGQPDKTSRDTLPIIIGVMLALVVLIIISAIVIGAYYIVKRYSRKATSTTYYVKKSSDSRDKDEIIHDSLSGPIYDKPVKDSYTKKVDETRTPQDDVANHHYNTTSHINCEEEEKVNISNNNNYAELNEDSATYTEHHYFVLENNSGRPQKGSEDITPDPDAPALPPTFKPEPPPVYQDINDLSYRQEETEQNEYATVQKEAKNS